MSDLNHFFFLIRDPVRYRIIELLMVKGSATYDDLSKQLNHPPADTLNFHLKKLKPLIARDEGRYMLTDSGILVVKTIYDHQSGNVEDDARDMDEHLMDILKPRLLERLLAVPPYFIPAIFTFALLINVLAVTLFGTMRGYTVISLGIVLITLSTVWMILVEKLYIYNNTRSILLFGVISYLCTWLLYIYIVRISPISDTFYHILYAYVIGGRNFTPDQINFLGPKPLYAIIFYDLVEYFPVTFNWDYEIIVAILPVIVAVSIGFFRYRYFPTFSYRSNFSDEFNQRLLNPDRIPIPTAITQFKWLVLHLLLLSLFTNLIGYFLLDYQKNNPHNWFMYYFYGKLQVLCYLFISYSLTIFIISKVFKISWFDMGRFSYIMIALPLMLIIQITILQNYIEQMNVIVISNLPGTAVTPINGQYIIENYYISDYISPIASRDYPGFYDYLILFNVLLVLNYYGIFLSCSKQSLPHIARSKLYWMVVIVVMAYFIYNHQPHLVSSSFLSTSGADPLFPNTLTNEFIKEYTVAYFFGCLIGIIGIFHTQTGNVLHNLLLMLFFGIMSVFFIVRTDLPIDLLITAMVIAISFSLGKRLVVSNFGKERVTVSFNE